MAAENIGELVQTKIPGLSDRADIQAALRLYHYGSYDYNPSQTSPSALVNPSIAHTINSLQTSIAAIDITTTIQKSFLNAKGDIISASADNTPELLTLGTSGQVLTVNTSTASGLQWVTPEVTLINSVTLTNKTLTAPVINLAFNSQTLTSPATSYTVVLADNGKMVEIDNASARTVIIPKNSVTAFPIGAQINVAQVNDGQVTFAPVDGDVTVNATPGLKLRTKFSSATLIKRDTNKWIIVGDLIA